MIKTGLAYKRHSGENEKICDPKYHRDRIKGYSERQIQALAFLIPFIIMLTLFGIKGIYPFGDRSFLSGDLYHQYMPFFSELLRKVRGGESLSFSYHVGIGSNFLALFVYYLASPFHVPALLVPEQYLIEFISYL
ncbi:MAG: YfhO family protein, partial [Acetatifactor sp.]|nr:YfhO family protein [Acetatifactor sp.]